MQGGEGCCNMGAGGEGFSSPRAHAPGCRMQGGEGGCNRGEEEGASVVRPMHQDAGCKEGREGVTGVQGRGVFSSPRAHAPGCRMQGGEGGCNRCAGEGGFSRAHAPGCRMQGRAGGGCNM